MTRDIESLRALDTIKVLADSRRLRILRRLMASPETLSQLGRALKRSPAWIRHHILMLQAAGLVELSEVRTTGKITEKYYRARAGAFLLQQVILPKSSIPVVVFSGSHDLALELLAGRLARHLLLLILSVGSLDGLINLRQGLCRVAGAHLLEESGQYNASHVRHLFPDREMELITLAYRTQGLMLAARNPGNITNLVDLARPNVRFINRNSGSGTRLWLDAELRQTGVLPTAIRGYERVVKTHTEAASLIETGRADVALGLQAAAVEHGLDFIPLFQERYDLVLAREQERRLAPLLDFVQTSEFRRTIDALAGYDTAHSGERIHIQ